MNLVFRGTSGIRRVILNPSGSTYSLTYLIVGGGAGGGGGGYSGGANTGGAGNAGQVVTNTISVPSSNVLVATVGTGGNAGYQNNSGFSSTFASNGNQSSLSGPVISTITALGGTTTPNFGDSGAGAGSGGNGVYNSIIGISLYFSSGGVYSINGSNGKYNGAPAYGGGGNNQYYPVTQSTGVAGTNGEAGCVILSIPTSNFNSSNVAYTKTFTGSIAGTTLTVPVTTSQLYNGMKLTGSGVASNTFIVFSNGGDSGGNYYTVNNNQTVASTSMTATNLYINGSNTIYVIPTTQNFYT